MRIRPFHPGEERALHTVFLSAVHGLAYRDYTAQQIEAWAPLRTDPDAWAERIRRIRPFVVEQEGDVVAYADVQADGYIDHFFVSARHARKGIGSMLMTHLHAIAGAHSITELASDVSRTAQPFFEKFGFSVKEQRSAVVRGVVVPNAHMRKVLIESLS